MLFVNTHLQVDCAAGPLIFVGLLAHTIFVVIHFGGQVLHAFS